MSSVRDLRRWNCGVIMSSIRDHIVPPVVVIEETSSVIGISWLFKEDRLRSFRYISYIQPPGSSDFLIVDTNVVPKFWHPKCNISPSLENSLFELKPRGTCCLELDQEQQPVLVSID